MKKEAKQIADEKKKKNRQEIIEGVCGEVFEELLKEGIKMIKMIWDIRH